MNCEMMDHALSLAGEGFSVLPVSHPESGGMSPGKRPLVGNWPRLATTETAQIEAWWHKWPNANIGIATGKSQNLFVFDIDTHSGGLESFEKLKSELGGWPYTVSVRTGSGGLHYYFQYPENLAVKNSAGRLGPGLDIRGDGGMVVAPPSLHSSGNRYEWIN